MSEEPIAKGYAMRSDSMPGYRDVPRSLPGVAAFHRLRRVPRIRMRDLLLRYCAPRGVLR